jgi:hypothetical protein
MRTVVHNCSREGTEEQITHTHSHDSNRLLRRNINDPELVDQSSKGTRVIAILLCLNTCTHPFSEECVCVQCMCVGAYVCVCVSVCLYSVCV